MSENLGTLRYYKIVKCSYYNIGVSCFCSHSESFNSSLPGNDLSFIILANLEPKYIYHQTFFFFARQMSTMLVLYKIQPLPTKEKVPVVTF